MKMGVLAGFMVAAMLCGAGSALAQQPVSSPPKTSKTDGGQVTTLETITVTAQKEGSAEKGYVVETAQSLGPWGDRKLKDTPYSVHIATEDFIENIQARSPGELFNRLPGVSSDSGHSVHNFLNYVNVRGFPAAGNNSTRFNGVPTGNTGGSIFLEEMGSVEVLTGLSGFMYGANNVGGSISYNFKRPLYERVNKLRFGTYGNEMLYGHLDLGGPIGDGKLAYRINLMSQNGDTLLKEQSLERHLISGALDWNVTDDLLVQLNASHGKIKLDGRQSGLVVNTDNFNAFKDPTISYGANNAGSMTTIGVPKAPANDRLWTPSDTYHDTSTTNVGLGVKYKINDHFNFRAATAYNEVNREMLWGMMYFTVDPDIYKYDIRAVKFFHKTTGAYAYLDADFDTGPLEHKLTIGANGYTQDTYNWSCMFDKAGSNGCAGSSRTLFTGSFSNPSLANNNNIAQYGMMKRLGPRGHRNNDSRNLNLVIGDSVKIGDQWEVMLGLNRSTIRNQNFNTKTGERTSFYKKSEITPTLALMFKPTPKVTTYVSYVEALEAGSIVPDNNQWSNRNQILSPLMSEQYEVGVKAEIGGMFLTAALFQIERGLQYGDTNQGKWVQDGYQRHRGLELTGRGKIGEDLTLMGGLNFLDAEIVKTGNPRHKGNSPAHVPKFSGKLYAEYALPFVDGLTLTGGLNHFGKSYTTPVNNVELPSYTTGDLGLRLETTAWGQNMIYRLNVNNITNEKYWYGGGSSHLHLGSPRNVALSAEIQF